MLPLPPALEPFRPDIALAVLELSRLGGVVAVAPIPWSNTPKRVKVGLLLFLLFVVHGQGEAPVSGVSSASFAALHVSSEIVVGLAIGMVVRLSIAAAEIAGSSIALPMGFAAAQAFDPTIGATDTVLTRIFRTLALLLAVIAGFHRAMLGALLSSFHLLPVGSMPQLEATFPIFLELSTHVISVGVRLALPLLSILLMANVALGFVARAAPTMQIFNVGFAVLLAVGAGVLLISLPELGHEIVAGFNRNAVYFERILVELRGP